MSSNSVTVRQAALDAPLLMLAYGVLRLLDGLDGGPGPGLAWNLGHLAFFAAMLLFGALAAGLVPLAPTGARRVATVAAAVTVLGVVCFLWVITGDLSPAFRDSTPLPTPLRAAGPMAFTLGMLTLLGLMVAARRVPVWSPLLFGAAVVAVTVNLNLLPLAALLLVTALAPLSRQPARPEPARTPRATSGPVRSRALH
ncbi:hypothetical protein AB0F81_42065 [Actinoplanes sp. NPDC024001]|uniref:hypothetical protein n=1 Tax=Actinoplanes sp. NPDC024001 TaxID=3154598 RepID=UPI0033F52DF6